MTTINAAAAMHVGLRSTIAALLIITGVGLSGCAGDSGGLLQANNTPLTANNPAVAKQAPATRGTIAIAPVIGAPPAIAKQIVGQLGTLSAKNRIGVATAPGAKVDYTLRGYIVAARESTATKVSYIWDVTNPTGARVHRITGEEVVKGAGAGDPWASVSPQVVQVIVEKTSTQLSAWMPKKAQPTPAAAPKPLRSHPGSDQVPVATAPTAARVASANTRAPVSTSTVRSGLQPRPAAPQASRTATGSLGGTGKLTALVPSVVGAPGDGSTALAAALRNELLRNGVAPTPPGQPAYRVEGRVKMGAVQNGQQPIKIDWVVRDPKGANLGTVSQENKIPAGSLNGNWGGTATAAATAATQGILKLLPKRTASR